MDFVIPRALFALDGTMHHISSKSELMDIINTIHYNIMLERNLHELFEYIFINILKSFAVEVIEEKGGSPENSTTEISVILPRTKIAIVDGMAEVQDLDKNEEIINCSQLYRKFKEIQLL